MAKTITDTGLHAGFLSILREANGSYLGGYLVTNQWGRPLEFRLSTAVQPNRIQQILYSDTLLPYLCADLIGKTLIDKSATEAQLILTDHPAALGLRLWLDVPVGWLSSSEHPAGTNGSSHCTCVVEGSAEHPGVYCHLGHPDDAEVLRGLLVKLGGIDLGEPFGRIRDAVAEARKMGVTHRA